MQKRERSSPHAILKKRIKTSPNTDLNLDKDLVREMIQLPGIEPREKPNSADIPAHNVSVSELEELDHIIVNVAYQLEQLLSRFKWLKQIDLESLSEDAHEDHLVRLLLKRYRVRLAWMLLKQYWEEGVPVFDYILSTRKSIGTGSLQQALGSDLKPQMVDELQALVLSNAMETVKSLKMRLHGDSDFMKRTEMLIRSQSNHDEDSAAHSESRSTLGRLANSNEASDEWPPELPNIQDDSLLQQVFTHRSAVTDASIKSHSAMLCAHNERLEFKGDSILDFIICDLLYKEFPDDSEGALSMKKASLVCNDTLFDISVAYGLHRRLHVSSDLRQKIYKNATDSVPDSSHKNKAIADVLEAYIAGVALSSGMIAVQDWLHKLYAPLISEMKSTTEPAEVNKNAKNELYRKVGSADQTVTYRTVNKESPFTVACIIGGDEVSTGTDRTVKLAGLRAAASILQNSTLIEKYAAKRRMVPKTAPTTGHYDQN